MVAAADLLVADALRRQGWSVLTAGWPDLLAYRDYRAPGRGAVMAIELKRGNDRLRPDQTEMARVFGERMGVPFYVARDTDIDAVLRKRGRIIAPGEALDGLRAEQRSLAAQTATLAAQLTRLDREIEATHLVFTRDTALRFRVFGRESERLDLDEILAADVEPIRDGTVG